MAQELDSLFQRVHSRKYCGFVLVASKYGYLAGSCQEALHPKIAEKTARRGIQGNLRASRPSARDEIGDCFRVGVMKHAVPRQVHPGRVFNEFVIDGRKIQLCVGPPIGEHGPRLTFHDNHDGSRGPLSIGNQVRYHCCVVKLFPKPLEVSHAHPADKIGLHALMSEPDGCVGSGSTRTLHDRGRGVGVMTQRHRNGGEDVINNIPHDKDPRLCHDLADHAVAISTATAMLLLTRSRFTPKLAPFECSTI